jgi:hypothetical protein
MMDRQGMSGAPAVGVSLRLHDKPVIGQMVGANIWELSVAGEPAAALAARFDACSLDFVVLHGLGGLVSRRFVGDLAHGCGGVLERLVIRREGAGTALASLCYADLRASNGRFVRVFSTDVASEHGTTKLAIRSMLLSRARTAVALVGEMPAHQMEDALIEMGRAVSQGSHRHRTMVIQPAYESVHTDASLIGMVQHSKITVRRAAAVRQAADAWPFLSGTWVMDRAASEADGGFRASEYDEGIAYEPVIVAPLLAREQVSGEVSPPPLVAKTATSQAESLDALVKSVMALRGEGMCCVFNVRSLAVLAQAGSSGLDASQLARQGRLLMAAMQTGSQPLQVGKAIKEATIRFAGHLLLMRELAGQADLWVLALLHADAGVDTRSSEEVLSIAIERYARRL